MKLRGFILTAALMFSTSFNVMAEEGAEVQPGTVLAEVNLEYLREKGIETVSPTVVCGGPEYRLRFEKITEAAAGKQLLYTIEHV